MAEPVTMAVMAGSSLVKGVGGYKSGKSASKAAMATAAYNRGLAELSASNQRSMGELNYSRDVAQAQQQYDVAMYQSDLLAAQADGVMFQTNLDREFAYRDSIRVIADMKSKIGTSGVTFAGSPAMQLAMLEYDWEVNDAIMLSRGLSAKNNLEHQQKLNQWAARQGLATATSDAAVSQWNSDIQAANIVNQGQAQAYSGQLKAYTAKAKATNALLGGIAQAGIQGAGAIYSS